MGGWKEVEEKMGRRYKGIYMWDCRTYGKMVMDRDK